MNLEKIIIISFFKSSRFLIKKNITRTLIKVLRHGSLQMNIINMLLNFENDQCKIKREILDQTIKVKK